MKYTEMKDRNERNKIEVGIVQKLLKRQNDSKK